LDDAIEAAAERLHRASPARQVEWDRAEARVDVLADWTRLGQIFDNLLSNADRFAPRSTPITVAVAREQPGVVTIRVSDRGPGIPPDLRERIFERFFRGAANGDSGGTGLGLAIAEGVGGGAARTGAAGGTRRHGA